MKHRSLTLALMTIASGFGRDRHSCRRLKHLPGLRRLRRRNLPAGSGCQSMDAAENILGRSGPAGHLYERRLHRSRIEPAGTIRHPTILHR